MKRHLNTLFVTTQGSYLAKDGETVAVRVEGETRLRVPIHNLGSIVCFGNVGCSPFVLGFCGRHGVGLSFLSESGRFLARLAGPVSGNVLLRREQYRRTDDPVATATIARAILIAKVANTRSLVSRAARERKETTAALQPALSTLGQCLDELRRSADLDTLRGIEGYAARAYFNVFNHFIVQQKESFVFAGRSRRPPRDNVNALLSFLYTLLCQDIVSALESVGLDPAVGYLHRERPGRPALALDLMEEFRPLIADRLALSLINLKQLKSSGFTQTESGGVTMDDATRKIVIAAYQKRKQEVILHPFLQEKTTVGLLFHLQALLLARCLRGDLDGYPPFIAK